MKPTRVLIPFALTALLGGAVWFTLQQLEKKLYGPQVKFNSAGWSVTPTQTTKLSARQTMVRDLILNVLPGKSRSEIEGLLGKSPTHDDMRRHTPEDYLVRERNEDGSWKPFPKTGTGYYYEELDWDLIYEIGYEQSLGDRHQGIDGDITLERLIVRFDSNDNFVSWYIHGSKLWPGIVGREGKLSFKRQSGRHETTILESTNISNSRFPPGEGNRSLLQ